MRRVLLTGMSGTGKSSALVELRKLGYDVVDTDEPGWTLWSDQGYMWREDRIAKLLANVWGKTPEQRELILRHLAEVEPLLRKTCTHEIDAAQPLATIVEQLAALGREPSA